MGLKYDNERDRLAYGYDAGHVVDGMVTFDEETKEYVLVDDEGVAFSSQHFLKSQEGKKIRLTCVSFEAMAVIEHMAEGLQSDPVSDG